MKKTKKQHYVPRCYLESFKIPGTYQINVYDKKLKGNRINSIYDIASENYFYDIKLSDVFTEELIKELNDNGISIDSLDNEQFIEHFLANTIESEFSILLRIIIDKVKTATPWYIQNCFFVSEEQKRNFSVCLAVQYIRTKLVRQGMEESSDCMQQALEDMKATQRLKDSMKITKDDLRLTHGRMILDARNIFEMVKSFYSLVWILGINRTSKHFYTSDAPIVTNAHIKHPFLSMSGLNSKGIEVFFPISPELILIMYDGDYFKDIITKDRNYVIISDEKNLDYYNSLTAMRSNRCIFSDIGDFTLIDKMINENSQVFEDNYITELHWAEKTYRPRKL